jgi:dynein heavy chain 2
LEFCLFICLKPIIDVACHRARGEVTIRESLDEIEGWLLKASFKLEAAVVNRTVTRIVKNWDDLFQGVADSMDLLNSVSVSQFFEPFKDRANAYECKLSSTHTFLMLLREVQRKVLYLDPIFLQGTLKSQRAQYAEFVAAPYLAIISGIDEYQPLVLDASLKQNLIDSLTMVVSHLNRCQKALQECLAEKRSLVPRFYFAGDEELLAMIGEGDNMETAQRCMKKLFQAIHRANIDETRKYIISMESESGEIVAFNKVSIHGVAKARRIVLYYFSSVIDALLRVNSRYPASKFK